MSGYEGKERRANSWHLHVGVPIGIIGAILFQCGCFIWYGAQLDSKVNQTATQVEQLEKWRSKQDDQLAHINEQQASEGQKLDDLSQTVHRMDEILEQHFYRK